MSNYGLPDGVTLGMVAAVLIPVGIVTVLLRALPFSMLRVLKGSPFIDFLAVLMPIGVMTVLVAYTLVGYAGSQPRLRAHRPRGHPASALVEAPRRPVDLRRHRAVHAVGERRFLAGNHPSLFGFSYR